MTPLRPLLLTAALSLAALPLRAAESAPAATKPGPAPAGRPAGGRKIVLGPDDKAAFGETPAEILRRAEGIPRGRLELIEYASRTVGTVRRLQVYTPPGFTADKPHPVLYLLHGIGGDENEWQRFAKVDVLFDNLIAAGLAKPMIVVMPNGRARKDDRATGDVYAAAPAFANFERDLLDDVLPSIEKKYGAPARREQRALAGLSMGGGQTFNFGLAHLDTFAWIGGFSAAPNTKPPAALVPDPQAARKQLRLLWVSCGNRDGLLSVSQGLHAYLKEKEVPHVWHVDGHGHDPEHWRNSLYWFSQKLFR
jgi:enterochelin esterase-like enzyme